MNGLTFRHPHLILDASCAISLYATNQMTSILAALPVQVAIVDYVSSVEMLTVCSPTPEDSRAKEVIDLPSFVQSGILQIVDLSPGLEQRKALEFAQNLDTGESFTA